MSKVNRVSNVLPSVPRSYRWNQPNAIRLAIVQTDISCRDANNRYSGDFVVGNIGKSLNKNIKQLLRVYLSQRLFTAKKHSSQIDLQPSREPPYSLRLYNKSCGIEQDKTRF